MHGVAHMRADRLEAVASAAGEADIHGGIGFEEHKTAIRHYVEIYSIEIEREAPRDFAQRRHSGSAQGFVGLEQDVLGEGLFCGWNREVGRFCGVPPAMNVPALAEM